MNECRKYYAAQNDSGDKLQISSLGIYEAMPAQTLRHTGEPGSYLLMYFHDAATVGSGTDAARQCMIWGPGEPRIYGNDHQPWLHSWLVIKGDSVKQILKHYRLPLNQLIPADAETIFVRYLSLMMDELNSRGSQDAELLEKLLDLFIYELHRRWNAPQAVIPDNLLRAERFMWQHIDKPVSLSVIAAAASLSVSRFIPLFKSYYGESPIQYLNRKRMNLAAQLLNYNIYSCKEVAEQTGFSDQLHFSRRFKAFWGVAPRDFRKLPT